MFAPVDPEQPPEEPLPREPMRAGEFIGHRIWEVRNDIGGFPTEKSWLQSFVMSCPWWPEVPMCDSTFNPNNHIEDRNLVGIWSFKDRENLYEYLKEWRYLQHSIIIGTVWLWGTVIEHKIGYRAQYAAIRSLDEVHIDLGDFDLEHMRNLYVRKRA